MRCTVVTAEYNPFHRGHEYLLRQVRDAGAEAVAVILGGNFTQRGEPALFSKFDRARAALSCGADLVAELPLPYAAAGAKRFARGAVFLADALGCADTLAFGSECGDLRLLEETAGFLETALFRERFRLLLAQGVPPARARTQAVEQILGPEAAAMTVHPNDILALEYLSARKAFHSTLRPLAVTRKPGLPSASRLRELALADGIGALRPYLPERAYDQLKSAPFCRPESLELPVLSRLRALDEDAFRSLPELSEGLENRLRRAVRNSVTLPELYGKITSARCPRARAMRLVLAAWLGIPNRLSEKTPPYLRILGCTETGKRLLGNAKLPLSGSLRKLEALGGAAREYAALEGRAGAQYALLQTPRGKSGMEYEAPFLDERRIRPE